MLLKVIFLMCNILLSFVLCKKVELCKGDRNIKCAAKFLAKNSYGVSVDRFDPDHPLLVKAVDINYEDIGVSVHKYNATYAGLERTVLNKIYLDKEANETVLELFFPVFRIQGDYRFAMVKKDGEEFEIISTYEDFFPLLTVTVHYDGRKNINRASFKTDTKIVISQIIGFGKKFYEEVFSRPDIILEGSEKLVNHFERFIRYEAEVVGHYAAAIYIENAILELKHNVNPLHETKHK